MIFSYILHLILAGLTGIHCKITTVSEVSVETGDSISIPCLYQQKYTDYVKYLCKGFSWNSCKIVVKTNNPDDSGKFSISDDKKQTTFTVTFNNLTDQDERSWWCVVEKSGRDIGQRFKLSVTTGMPKLYGDRQEVEAVEGGSVTVICRYNDLKNTEWCRLCSSTCVAENTGSIDGATVTVNRSVSGVFNVTMGKLRMGNSGWYWCSNKVFQMPLKLTVHEFTPTTTTATTKIPSTALFTATTAVTTQHSSLPKSTEQHTAQLTDASITGTGGQSLRDGIKISTKMIIIIASLVALPVLVLVAFFGCWMIRCRKTKPETPDIAAGSQTWSDPDMQYSTIAHNQHVAARKKQDSTAEESVTYSTIVLKDNVPQNTEPADGSVIYSTLAAR